MKFTFRYVDKIVGLFILIAIIMLAVIIVFAGVNKRWFSKRIHYTSFFTSAEGLKVGMDVNLRGFEIGRVKDIRLNKTNQVELDFYIYETYHDRVKPDSVLALSSSLFGTAGALDFYPGLTDEPALAEGALIPSTQSGEGKMLVKTHRVDKPDSGDSFTEILNQIPEILENIDNAIVLVRDAVRGSGNDALSDTVRNAKDITSKLNYVMNDTRNIVESLAMLSSQLENPTGLVPTLLNSDGTLDMLFNDENRLWDMIIEILNKVDGAVYGLQELSLSLADMSPQIALTLSGMIHSLEQAQNVMEGLQNNPLLKGGITEDKEVKNPGFDIRMEDF